jgi:uncharacterized protein YcgL (UPF0745 family)
MRWLLILLMSTGFSLPASAQIRVSVAQLEQFLTSRRAAKEADADIADRLTSVQLSEQLTVQTLKRIQAETHLGPKTIEQLRLLADSSIFSAPPSQELQQRAAPNGASQDRMIGMAVRYVDTVLRQLPDFLAIRITDSFDNIPDELRPKHGKPKAQLHLRREFRREIAYRNGQETTESTSKSGTEAETPAEPGLTTWGEFGPILRTVLSDSFKGSVRWNRWQLSEDGTQVAVFRYSVPRPVSDYLIDFCCYRKSKSDPLDYRFNDKPGYHGELYLVPETGAIDRITVEAEMNEADPVVVSAIAVQYGKVSIAGKSYIGPIHCVALSELRNLVVDLPDQVVSERHLNEIRFIDYHKFQSTSRIISDGKP